MRTALVVFLLASSAAFADGPDPRALYEQALKHYNLAEYSKAIEDFKAAYVITQAPELLYNIGQAYRLSGRGSCTPALQFYRSYLRNAPSSPKRASVEAAIRDMEKCAADEPPPAPAPIVRAAEPIVERPTLVAKPVALEPTRRTWLLPVVGGGGLIVAGVGTGLLISARADFDHFNTVGCAPYCGTSSVDPLRLRNTLGLALIASGAAIAVTGFIVWFFSKHLEPAVTF